MNKSSEDKRENEAGKLLILETKKGYQDEAGQDMDKDNAEKRKECQWYRLISRGKSYFQGRKTRSKEKSEIQRCFETDAGCFEITEEILTKKEIFPQFFYESDCDQKEETRSIKSR